MSLTQNHTCCFTGHRLIVPQHRQALPVLLEATLRGLIADSYYIFAVGGALGFDTLCAETVLALQPEFPHLRLLVVAPCADQSDGWSRIDQLRYERIRQAASDFICLGMAYTRDCMKQRNLALIEMSTVCISYCLRERTGSAQTVSFARRAGLRLIELSELL